MQPLRMPRSEAGGGCKIESRPPLIWARGTPAGRESAAPRRHTTVGAGGHGTALGLAPRRLAVAAASQLLGSRGAADGVRHDRTARMGRAGDEPALPRRRSIADRPRPVAPAGLRAAHGAAQD